MKHEIRRTFIRVSVLIVSLFALFGFNSFYTSGNAPLVVFETNGGTSISSYTLTNNTYLSGTSLSTPSFYRMETTASGDINGDGFDDLVVGGWSSPLLLYISNNGVLSSYISLDNSITSRPRPIIVDADGDGDIDIIAAHSNSINLYKNNGDNTFTKQVLSTSTSYDIYHLAAGLKNDDSVIDIFFYNNKDGQEKIHGLISDINNPGDYLPLSTFLTGSNSTYHIHHMDLFDVNSDGEIDLLFSDNASDSKNYIRYLIGTNGNSFYTTPSRDEPNINNIDLGFLSSNTILAFEFVDLDNDGVYDIFYQNNNTSFGFGWIKRLIDLTLEKDENDAIIHRHILQDTGGYGEPNYSHYRISDIDGDGSLDILLFGDASVYTPTKIYMNDINSPGTFTLSTYNQTEDVTDLSILDSNGDGLNDIVYASYTSKRIVKAPSTGPSSYLLSVNNPTKTGYNFAGWYYDSDLTSRFNTSDLISSNITLYAKWTPRTFSVVFNGNTSTSGSMANQTFEYGIQENLNTNLYVKTGYSFTGWNTVSDGSGVNYTDSEAATILSTTTYTLYAQWIDSSKPTITLNGSQTLSIEAGSTYVDAGATFSDNLDPSGNIVVIGADLDTNVIGTYTITYDTNDAAGNIADQITRTVNVIDTTIPTITLVGDSTITIQAGSIYLDQGVTISDNVAIVGNVTITGSVDTSALGSYSIFYDYQDPSSNVALQVTRTVTVVDTLAPVITLLGTTTLTIEAGSTYVDAGATFSDNLDLTGSITVAGDTVDTATLGTYILTFDASDSEGNVALQVTRTVTVVDTLAPVITLLGTTTLTIEAGSTYVDAGATFSDNLDLTGSITVAGDTVDTATLGTYILTFDASDSEGNVALQVTRTVTVVDTLAPVITLLGTTTLTIEAGSTYVDAGATFSDNLDLTGSITVAGDTVDTATLGTYILTFDASDSEGNVALQVTRTVTVVDTLAPVITLLGTTTLTIEAGSTYVDAGATFSDNLDLTGSITVAGDTVDTATLGTYILTFDASDSEGNVALQVTRTVTVVDTLAPVITLLGTTTLTIEAGSTYVDAGATFSDNLDLTGSITVAGDTVDTATLGTYILTFDASDSEGNVALQVTRTVTVVDTLAPVITLLGTTTLTIEAGSTYVDAGATFSDNLDLTGSITVAGDTVDTATLGTYILTFDASDSEGNVALQVTRTVTVVDTLAPVITLLGTTTLTIEAGSTYVDAGATFSDNLDLTGSITVAGDTVDTATLGTYILTFDASDSEGNVALQVTRTVTVVDTLAPVITLLGTTTLTIEAGSTYVDAGATFSDNLDLTGSITVAGDTVDTATLGTYILTFDASDSEGNVALQVTRTVTVVDTLAPVITLLGTTTLTIEAGSTYVDAGATFSDNLDLTGSITVAGDTVDTATLGTYILTFDASDSEGNVALQVTRTVTVVDTLAPVITLLGTTTLTIEAGSTYVDAGATFSDNLDLTGSITVAGDTVDTATLGTYILTFDASDSEGNVALQVTRTVTVVDTLAPVITLLGTTTLTIEAGSTYVDAGATFSDNLDLTGSITVAGDTVDTATLGTYILTFDASDSEGNVALQVTRTVTVVDTLAPVITLLGTTTLTIEAGSTYVDAGATFSDNLDLTGSITVAGDTVDTATLGTYILTFDASDSEGNVALQVTRTVTVVDTLAPIVNGVEHEGAYQEAVVISFNEGIATLNGESFDNQTSVTREGNYTLVVTDESGNTTTITFEIISSVESEFPILTLVISLLLLIVILIVWRYYHIKNIRKKHAQV